MPLIQPISTTLIILRVAQGRAITKRSLQDTTGKIFRDEELGGSASSIRFHGHTNISTLTSVTVTGGTRDADLERTKDFSGSGLINVTGSSSSSTEMVSMVVVAPFASSKSSELDNTVKAM